MSTAAIAFTDGGDRIHREARWSTPAARSNTPIDEFAHERTYLPRNLRTLDKLQREPAASQEIDLPGLGRYPGHTMANASAFDAYCHPHLDLAPILGRPPANRKPPHTTLYAAQPSCPFALNHQAIKLSTWLSISGKVRTTARCTAHR
jgi:hypothetical protein